MKKLIKGVLSIPKEKKISLSVNGKMHDPVISNIKPSGISLNVTLLTVKKVKVIPLLK